MAKLLKNSGQTENSDIVCLTPIFYSIIENLALWARSQFSGFTI